MGRIGLTHGVGTNVGSFVLAGAGAVTGASSDQMWLQIVGWAGMVVGLLLLAWGITWDGEQWWKRWFPKALKSPIRVANKLYIDCAPVGHSLGGPAIGLYSAYYCIEVENASDNTLRGLKAVIRDGWGDDTGPLLILGRAERVIDLDPHEKVRIELGRLVMQMDPGHVPGIERGDGYCVLSDGEINNGYNHEKGIESFQASDPGSDRMAHVKGQKMAPFSVLITAADTPAQIVCVQGDLWNVQSRDRLEIKSIGRPK